MLSGYFVSLITPGNSYFENITSMISTHAVICNSYSESALDTSHYICDNLA